MQIPQILLKKYENPTNFPEVKAFEDLWSGSKKKNDVSDEF